MTAAGVIAAGVMPQSVMPQSVIAESGKQAIVTDQSCSLARDRYWRPGVSRCATQHVPGRFQNGTHIDLRRLSLNKIPAGGLLPTSV
ncbi:MAG: hypothetical protein WAM11_07810 [Cyanobium sp.]